MWLYVYELRDYCLFIQLRTAALRLIVRFWLDVPTFATKRLHACHHARAPSGGRWNCGREMSGNLPKCRKATTWDRRLYFPTEGRRAENFFALKNPTGVKPGTWVPKVKHATSRPPKPQTERYYWLLVLCESMCTT